MRSSLIVVDGPNLYNDVGRHLNSVPSSAPTDVQKRYFLSWFDVDRLIWSTLANRLDFDPGYGLGAVIFHSRKALGEPPYNLNGEETAEFWVRQGSNPNMSAMLVDLAGAPKGQEKGIDTSIVVYLYETHASWDAAVLFTNDADFAPVVWSLRRKGKSVYGSSPAADTARPLVQACQDFIKWDILFLGEDRAFFEFLQPGGRLDEFINLPQVAEREPFVRIGSGLELGLGIFPGQGEFDKSGECVKTLHGMLPKSLSAIQDVATGFRVQAGPDVRSACILQGLCRHATLFETSTWSRLCRSH
jgi:NYN domain-containing protein